MPSIYPPKNTAPIGFASFVRFVRFIIDEAWLTLVKSSATQTDTVPLPGPD